MPLRILFKTFLFLNIYFFSCLSSAQKQPLDRTQDDFFVNYECLFVDEVGVPTGAKLNIAQFNIFSYLNWSTVNTTFDFFGTTVNKYNDPLINYLISELGPIKSAYFFKDKSQNRYRVIIHKLDKKDNSYSGYFINTHLEFNQGHPNISEQILYQLDLKCFKKL